MATAITTKELYNKLNDFKAKCFTGNKAFNYGLKNYDHIQDRIYELSLDFIGPRLLVNTRARC